MKRTRKQAGLPSMKRGNVKKRRIARAPRKPKAILNRRTGGFLGFKQKYFDSACIGVTISTSASLTGGEYPCNTASGGTPTAYGCIGMPSVGDGETFRDGNEIRVTSIDINGRIIRDLDISKGDTYAMKVFLALVLDTQPNAAQLDSEDVYVNPSNSAALASCPLRNLEYSKRFKVLRTVECDLNDANFQVVTGSPDIYYTQQVEKTFRFNVPTDIVVQFSGTAGTISSISSNAFNIVAFSSNGIYDGGSVTQEPPLLVYNARVRYMEIQ